MKCDKKSMLLYAVTDRKWTGKQTLLEQVKQALDGGVTCVQLREKELDKEEFLAEAIKLRRLCNEYKVPFIINDDVDIAVKCGADGVHVGQEDMEALDVRKIIGENMIMGVSVHDAKEALQAVNNGADYLGVGAVFSTSTKLDASVLPFDTVKEVVLSVNVPVVAIGGINKNNISMLSGTGVDGVALVSAIFSSENIKEECVALRRLSENMVKG